MLKRYVFLRRAQIRRSKTFVGFSFVLFMLLIGSFFLSSFLSQHHSVHAAKPAVTAGVSKTWYFAEGRVGGGFREYITIGNPSAATDCSATISYLPEGEITDAQAKGRMAARKPLLVRTITITHSSRYTAAVNQDLGVAEGQQPGMVHATMVTVPATSGCAGVVVERPMYFSYHGVTSGSDILGTTTLAQNFYLADVPTQAGTSSFMKSYITVLNPSDMVNAQVHIQYIASGSVVSTQTLYIAPGASGTIYPGTLPHAHVGAIISANTPVAVERSTYVSNIQEGNAGIVSSAASVVPAQLLSNQWLFAEGYTGGKYQESLVLSNLSGNDTNAIVTLEYQNGHHQTVTVLVPANSQVIENVNTLNNTPSGTCDVTPCITTPEVSAEVTADAASLVVERQMYFRYTHTLPNSTVNVTTIGGSDVTGGLVAATNIAHFAEGYTNANYNEWITLQNPTSASETLALTVVNEYARSYTQNIIVTAKTRQTVDITDMVRNNLVHNGDDFRAYQVSALVQTTTTGDTFVAERPMYFNTSQHNQGGTDVIGFMGISSTLPYGVVTNFPVPSSNGVSLGEAALGSDIVAGPDGNLWFTEDIANKIGVMTPTGLLIAGYSIPTANGFPVRITPGPDGRMWFTETQGNKIGAITTNGQITEYSTTGSYPFGITVGPDGNLWFTEGGNQIGKITTSGQITMYSSGITSASQPFDIVAGPDGNLWFTEMQGNKIGKITTGGTVTEYSGITGSNPQSIIVGPDSNLWFVEYGGNEIGKITTGGTVTEYPIPTASSYPLGITAGPDGNLWFTEYSGHQIGKITTAGNFTEYSASGSPISITAGPDGNLWFTQDNAGQIGRFILDSSPTPFLCSTVHHNC